VDIVELARTERWDDVLSVIGQGKCSEHYNQVLLMAAEKNKFLVVERLLDKGANTTFRSIGYTKGWTALHWAVYWKRPKVLKLLIEKGASILDRAIVVIVNYYDGPIVCMSPSDGDGGFMYEEYELTAIELAARLHYTDSVIVMAKTEAFRQASYDYGLALFFVIDYYYSDSFLTSPAAMALLENDSKITFSGDIAFAEKDAVKVSRAISYGTPALIQKLINKGLLLLDRCFVVETFETGDGRKTFLRRTPIEYAASVKRWDVLKMLIENYPPGQGYSYEAALFYAVDANDSEATNELLSLNVPATWHSPVTGDGPLHCAVKNNNQVLLKKLLLTRCNLAKQNFPENRRSIAGKTPMQLAAHLKHWDLVRLFIETENTTRGDQIRVSLRSVLIQALNDKQEDIVNLLFDHCDEWPDQISDELISKVIAEQKWDLLDKILEKYLSCDGGKLVFNRVLLKVLWVGNGAFALKMLGERPDLIDCSFLIGVKERGHNALHLAAHYGLFEVAQILIRNNAEHTHTTLDNKTAIQIAAERGHWVIFEYLFFLNPNRVDAKLCLESCRAVLHAAIANKSDKLVNAFLEYGADVRVVFDGKTALALAESYEINNFYLIYNYFYTYCQTTGSLKSDQLNFDNKDFKARLDNFSEVLAAINPGTGAMTSGKYASVSFRNWKGQPSRYQTLRDKLLALSADKRKSFFEVFNPRLQELKAADDNSLAAHMLMRSVPAEEMASGAGPAEAAEAVVEENYFQNIYNYLTAGKTGGQKLRDQQKKQFIALLKSIDKTTGALDKAMISQVQQTKLRFFKLKKDTYETLKEVILKLPDDRKRLRDFGVFKENLSLLLRTEQSAQAGAEEPAVGPADDGKKVFAREILDAMERMSEDNVFAIDDLLGDNAL
jgi:ankyrin repeat protein